MYTQIEKTKENNSRSVADTIIQKKSSVKQGSSFVDNRPKVHYVQKNQRHDLQRVRIIQRQGTVEEFLQAVVGYVAEIEEYSHRGYEFYGEKPRGRVEQTRKKLLQKFDLLNEDEKIKLYSKNYDWNSVDCKFDKDLIYFYATNLHIEALNSVSYQKEVQEYHQNHLAGNLDEGNSKNPNYATMYYDIRIKFNRAGKQYWIDYRGSYAGRSGKYYNNQTIIVPANKGYGEHNVASTFSDQPARYETFTDNHSREFDSEVAIFEDLSYYMSQDLKGRGIPHFQSSGTINLYTDRATCNSCTTIAMKFQNEWNVQVNVIHGGVDDGKGYTFQSWY